MVRSNSLTPLASKLFYIFLGIFSLGLVGLAIARIYYGMKQLFQVTTKDKYNTARWVFFSFTVIYAIICFVLSAALFRINNESGSITGTIEQLVENDPSFKTKLDPQLNSFQIDTANRFTPSIMSVSLEQNLFLVLFGSVLYFTFLTIC